MIFRPVGLATLLMGPLALAPALRAASTIGAASPTPVPSASPATTPTPARNTASPARSFCAEWIRQSREGYERVTLFADGNVVWKRSRDGKDDLLRKAIAPEEVEFYCTYFDERRRLGPDARLADRSLRGVHGAIRADARSRGWRAQDHPLRRFLPPARRRGGCPGGARRAEGGSHESPRARVAVRSGSARGGTAPEAFRRRRLSDPKSREGPRNRRARGRDATLPRVQEDRGPSLPVLSRRNDGERGAPGTIRISAGRWKGRRLEVPDGARPTSARAREALFDILAHRIAGALVLDLHAGSGAVGIEAVSRGARRAVLVERDSAVLRENVRTLAAGDALEVVASDSAAALRMLGLRDERFDVVFSDPPYGTGDGPPPSLPDAAALVAPGGIFVLQRDALPSGAEPDAPVGFARVAVRRYGRNILHFFEPAGPNSPPSPR